MIKILHLFSDSLNLYGDYENVTALCQRLEEMGEGYIVDRPSSFEPINLEGYNMIYIGHGTARNLAAIAPHFASCSDSVRSSIESNQLWLVIGNSRELFGMYFTATDGSIVDGAGIFDYYGIEKNRVFVSDFVGRPCFARDRLVYGFINCTASLMGKTRYPLFEVAVGCGEGEPHDVEGTQYKNFFGTWCMGPILARNPVLMREILRRLLGSRYRECDYSLEQKALDLVVSEFELQEGGDHHGRKCK